MRLTVTDETVDNASICLFAHVLVSERAQQIRISTLLVITGIRGAMIRTPKLSSSNLVSQPDCDEYFLSV